MPGSLGCGYFRVDDLRRLLHVMGRGLPHWLVREAAGLLAQPVNPNLENPSFPTVGHVLALYGGCVLPAAGWWAVRPGVCHYRSPAAVLSPEAPAHIAIQSADGMCGRPRPHATDLPCFRAVRRRSRAACLLAGQGLTVGKGGAGGAARHLRP